MMLEEHWKNLGYRTRDIAGLLEYNTIYKNGQREFTHGCLRLVKKGVGGGFYYSNFEYELSIYLTCGLDSELLISKLQPKLINMCRIDSERFEPPVGKWSYHWWKMLQELRRLDKVRLDVKRRAEANKEALDLQRKEDILNKYLRGECKP